MVTRIDKSSKTRNGTEYLLLWRTARDLGVNGQVIVNKAIGCDSNALDQIEQLAWFPKKRPALVAWLNKKKREAKRLEKKRLASN